MVICFSCIDFRAIFYSARSYYLKVQVPDTLHIEERMNLTTYINEDDESESDEWLPCSCQSGWNEYEPARPEGHSADSIFDCSCSKASNKAQCTK